MVAALRLDLDRARADAARWHRIKAAWDAGRSPEQIDDLIAEILAEELDQGGREVRRAG